MSRDPNVKLIGSVRQDMQCKLTVEEMRQAHSDLGNELEKLSLHAAREKNLKAQLKSEGEIIENSIQRLGAVSRSGEEYRMVVVETHADYQAGLIFSIRTDTYEQISSRKMTEDERQAELFEEGDGEDITSSIPANGEEQPEAADSYIVDDTGDGSEKPDDEMPDSEAGDQEPGDETPESETEAGPDATEPDEGEPDAEPE